jgi:hypothetical protein
VIYDLIMQGVTIALVIYFGLHLRSQLRTLKSTVTAQKSTIDAQAEQMKAQSTVLQDVERLYKIMQQVIDFVGPEAQLQREQARREQVDRDALTLRPARVEAWYTALRGDDFDPQRFARSEAYATLKDYLPEDLQQMIDRWQDPNVVVLSGTGSALLQGRLLEAIAKVEREWELI